MEAKKQLWDNILKKYNKQDLFEIIKNNKLTLLLKSELEKYEHLTNANRQYLTVYSSINKIKKKIHLQETEHIDRILRLNSIVPIHFKGDILDFLLYNQNNSRIVGEIDIYVKEEDLERAKNIIYKDGYQLTIHYGEKNPHHIVFRKNDIILELHRHILNPVLHINESFILDHIMNVEINNHTFCTFDYSATLLHLLYHYYMDWFLSINWVDPNIVFCYQDLKSIKNELLKKYEIVAYAEKYSNKISWDSVFNDIYKQKLQIYFKDMLTSIYSSYPKSIISNTKHKMDKIIYYIDNNSPLKDFYNYKSHNEYKNNTEAVRNYIKDCFRGNVLSSSYSDTFNIIKESSQKKYNGKDSYVIYGTPPKSDADLSYKFKIYNNYHSNSIKLEIFVCDDVLIFPDKLPVQSLFKSDCVTLYLVNCENDYKYYKLFFIPIKIGNDIQVYIFDEYNHTEVKSGITAIASVTKDGYYLEISISYNFMWTNKNLNNIYFDIFVNDCDSEEKGRKTTLNFSGNTKEWFDVTQFATLK